MGHERKAPKVFKEGGASLRATDAHAWHKDDCGPGPARSHRLQSPGGYLNVIRRADGSGGSQRSISRPKAANDIIKDAFVHAALRGRRRDPQGRSIRLLPARWVKIPPRAPERCDCGGHDYARVIELVRFSGKKRNPFSWVSG